MNITNLNARKAAAAISATALLFAVTWGARPVLAAPPSAPVITTPAQSTSTNPITLEGTADATTTIQVSGGALPAGGLTDVSGNWSVLVNLTPDSVNNLEVVSTSGTSTSATSTVAITHFTPTSTPTTTPPIITINGENPTSIFACNGYTDAGASAVSATGTALTVASTTNLNIEVAGTYTVVYSATDSDGNSASSTRSVIVNNCNTGSGGGSSSSGGGSSRTPSDSNSSNTGTGSVIAGMVTGSPTIGGIVGIPSTGGDVLGAATFQFTFTLRFGMSGPEVAELQRRLWETGYFRGPITGYFGPLTRDALIRLQVANGLVATGELDGPTIILLNS